ncbi:MAG: tRNA (adenosine(37)-N6)-threonylcarbamoyltransferase complex dimerization subunit type 1 TsaB [Bacillota bacterium]|nr:tRNA (adenosine(37)-N6)-threonylcarbamoyltransferase complex dimerization subunit type 1 TsaB [Bacillota bacterium]
MTDFRLVIDSSGDFASVALFRGTKRIASAESDRTKKHAQTLLPLIDRVLVQGGRTIAEQIGATAEGTVNLATFAIKPSQLAAIYVCVGPGSFTGVRVAVATAKGLAYPHRIPLYAFRSGLLHLCAYAVAQEGKDWASRIACAVPAGRGELYYTLFAVHDDVAGASSAAASVEHPKAERPWSVLEAGLIPEVGFVERAEAEGWKIVREPQFVPHVKHFFKLPHRVTEAADLGGVWQADVRTVVPEYYRKAQAEELYGKA